MKDFGTSEPPKSTRSSTTHWCPGRLGHPAFRHNIASSLRLHTGLPYDWTPRSDAPLGSPLAPSARRVSRVASRLPGTTTRLRFALHGYRGLPPAFASLGSGGWTRPPPGGSRSGYAGCGRHRHQERQNGVSNLRGPVEGAGRDGEGEVSQKPTKGFKTYEPGFGVHRRQIPAP